MTSDPGNNDVVVCVVTTPQIIMSESVVCSSAGTGGSRLATAAATVELGRRLLLAARAGDTARVLDLMARGAPFTTDWLGTSPLHLAAGNGHADTCGVLLRAGFSREARSKVRRTPLHAAAAGGHARALRVLLDAGAAPDPRDMLRMTPLHWAAQRGHAAAAAALLARGADPRALSKFRKTPRDLAAGRPELLRLLDEAARRRPPAEPAEPPDPPEPRLETVPKLQETKQSKPKPEKTIKVQASLEDLQSTGLKRDDLIKMIENAMKDRGTKTVDTIIDQMDVSTTEPQMQFETISRVQEEKETGPKPESESMDTEPEGSSSAGAAGPAAGAQLLRRHGITLLPADEGSTVLNALQSGRTVVLSDAGKLMLKESSASSANIAKRNQGAGASASGTALASETARAGVVLTATPVREPPRGVKVFTLNNKLLALPRAASGAGAGARPALRRADAQDMQVKFVQLPADAKVLSPAKARARPRPAPGARPSVKIIMNKTNFDKLIATGGAKNDDGENAVEVEFPTESAPEGSVRQLRTQLQAAQLTIAELRAELRACRDRLAHYE